MTLAMSGATPEDAGLASGLVNTTQQVGGALGLAVLSTFSATHTEDRLADGASRGRRRWWTATSWRSSSRAGFAAAAIAFAATVLEPTPETGDRGAARRGARGGRRKSDTERLPEAKL